MIVDCIIGIDPGASGGIAVWRPNHITECVKMPKDIKDLRDYLLHLKGISSPLVFLEKLSVRPTDVGTNEDGSQNFGKMYRIQTMIQNFEQLKALLEILEIPFVMVHPMTWQSKLKLRRKGAKEDKQVRKNRYKAYAQANYTDLRVTLWNADALLLMHFGRHILITEPNWVRSNLPNAQFEKLL